MLSWGKSHYLSFRKARKSCEKREAKSNACISGNERKPRWLVLLLAFSRPSSSVWSADSASTRHLMFASVKRVVNRPSPASVRQAVTNYIKKFNIDKYY